MDIVGRDAELEEIARFLEQGPPRALVVEGSAGMGKTTLWRAALEGAKGRGLTVVAASPSASEADIGFTVLGDLMAEVDDALLEALPTPQRRALELALLRREAERPPEGRALALGLVGVLSALAERERVLVAIDDAQWVDPSSRQVLAFAFRRLAQRRFHWLIARRLGDRPDELSVELGRSLSPERLVTRVLPPLSLGALARLVRQRLGLELRRPGMLELQALSSGNPLFALELAPLIAAGKTALDLPASLTEAVGVRLRGLDAETLDALLVAAVSPSPTLDEIQQALDVRDAWPLLAPARARNVVKLEGTRVAFVHPLLPAAVLGDADPRRRAALHRRLAAIAGTAELRAHHLAAAAQAPDAPAALAVEAGAREALLRGAPEVAARLASRARELTDDGDRDRELGLLEARCVLEAGDVEGGRALLADLAERAPPGPGRARIVYELARAPRNHAESVELCEAALIDAAGDPGLAAEIAVTLAVSLFLSGEGDRAVAQGERAIGLAEQAADELTAARGRAAVAMMEGARGHGWDLDVMRRAADTELAMLGRPRPDGAAIWFVQSLEFQDRLDEARERALDLRTRALEAGEAMAAADFADQLGMIELRSGHLDAARQLVQSALEELEQIGWEERRGSLLGGLAAIYAWQGKEDETRAAAAGGVQITRGGGERLGDIRYYNALTVLELGLENHSAAAELAEAGLAAQSSMLGDASVVSFHGYAIEAHAALGRVERARELVVKLETDAVARPTPRLRMVSLRSRGLTEAAAGDLAAALGALDTAVAAAEELGSPHEWGRTLLMQGRALRRAGRKREARAALVHAAELLDESGAALFARQARAELLRIPGRRPGRPGTLTEGERRIAEAVSEGRSNREVAAQLFLSVKTVELTLTRVYRKLGVRNRAELAARFPEVAREEEVAKE